MLRAKFRVQEITCSHYNKGRKNPDVVSGYSYDVVEMRTIRLKPVYSEEENSENKRFWDATPAGALELGVINKEAWQHFALGQEFYIDFTPADKPAADGA